MAVAVLFGAASCAKEDISSSIANGETVEVTFTANLPELGTRAIIGEGESARTLKFFVYEYQNDEVIGTYLPAVKLYTADDEVGTNVITSDSKFFNFSLSLIKGMKYNIVFWADKGTDSPYSVVEENGVPTGVISANYSNVNANDDTLDAFFGALKNFDPAAADAQARAREIKLYRPFAQLNAKTNDIAAVTASGATLTKSSLTVETYTTLDLFSGAVGDLANVTFKPNNVLDNNGYISMNYLLAPETKCTADVTFDYEFDGATVNFPAATYTYVPLQRNYKTNILGSLLTKSTDFTVEIKPGFDNSEYEVEGDVVTANVDTAEEFAAAFDDNSGIDVVVLEGDINLNNLLTRAVADPSYTVKAGKNLTIDLNGKKLSATSTQTGKNYNMFEVRGTLTVKNGTIEYEHKGENMEWNSSTNIFNVTAGGVLNLEGVTATNLGGSDMGFVAHLNNWGEVTLNVENSTLESNYVPVRVFNSGNDMNNVDIKNSTLKGGSYAFWVHNYTAVDFGSEAKAEAQKALLNLNIYNQGNTFSPDLNGIRYGFTNSIRTDAYGITKTVSEDGTVVTLGSIIENGLIRRGVAGDEENTTITKVVIGEGVGVLYDRTFRRFYALETVELPSTLTTIGAAGSGVFQSCTNLKNIVLPESVTVLGKGSFQECSSLESINIPAGVTRIESDALRNTGLKEVEFHAGVTYFGAQAFRDCKQLTKVVINAPEFTMEGNTFGIMAAPYTPMTIEVANAEMKAYVESKLTAHAKTYITVVAPELIDNATALQAALAEGKNVALANDLTINENEMLTAPYGNKMALSQNGGVFNGNGKNIAVTANGDNYVVMTAGGTIKNLDIDRGFRGIVLMYPNQDVYVDNVNIGVDDEVCYTINTAEGDGTHSLYVSNSTLYGWCSIGTAVKDVTFTNCTFGQGTYYTNVYGRLVKPYVNAIFDGCEFGSKFYIDLSALVADQVVTLKNCTVNGVKLTAQNWASLVAPEDTCGEGQISIELKNGTYMTADNVADYVIFE